MEFGLKAFWMFLDLRLARMVSILVVMEFGLKVVLEPEEPPRFACFNPCCNGIRS